MDNKQGLAAIHLFAGSGGGILGGLLCGWRTVCAVELDEHCREVLVARQNDGTLEPFPIWDDVRTFDGLPWRGRCDVVCGGFPCTSISPLGKRAGISGPESCLWCEMARIVGEVRPTWVFSENSPDLTRLGLDVALQDLAALGYDAEWRCLSAAELGASHIRDRIWILGRAREAAAGGGASASVRANRRTGGVTPCSPSPEDVRVLADAYLQRRKELRFPVPAQEKVHTAELQGEDVQELLGKEHDLHARGAWPPKPDVRRLADGIPFHVEQLRGYGNAQVPVVAARAFLDLAGRFEED